jgi:ATP-dependent HslUV protease ATP-binding subunit HslU
LETEALSLEFVSDAVAEIATMAEVVNLRTENIGARRLHTILENLLDDISFDAPNAENKEIIIDADYVRERLDDVVKNEDLSRYIL